MAQYLSPAKAALTALANVSLATVNHLPDNYLGRQDVCQMILTTRKLIASALEGEGAPAIALAAAMKMKLNHREIAVQMVGMACALHLPKSDVNDPHIMALAAELAEHLHDALDYARVTYDTQLLKAATTTPKADNATQP